MIRLTRWDGESILVNPRHIVIVTPNGESGATLHLDVAAVAQPSPIDVQEMLVEVAHGCDTAHG